MNFEHMPELKWAYGYFLVIGVIVAICATLYVQFRARSSCGSAPRCRSRSSAAEE
jgi:Mg2+ and Co2+ transporter CorA